MVNRMYTVQIERLDRMYEFIMRDERFKSLDMLLQVHIILSFFIHCYHLGDWLRESGVDEKKVYGYIDKTDELKDCRDITNITKHLLSTDQLKKPKHSSKLYDWKSARVPSPISRYYNYFTSKEEEREVLVISIDGEERHCFNFMQRCMEKWNEFLDYEGLDRKIT